MITAIIEYNKLEYFEHSLFKASRERHKPDTDKKLIEQIERGSRNAMKRLYDKYYLPLTSFMNTCLNCDQTILEILNNSFFDIWSGRKIWDRQQSAKVFILSIVRKKINAHNETIKRTLSHGITMESSSEESGRRIKPLNVQEQLTHLPPEHRGLLFLFYEENLSYEQIAIIENCSADDVKKQFLTLIRLLKTQVN